MRSVKTILFPTDYSANSAHAVPLACELALAQGARLLALHVIQPPNYTGEFNVPKPPPPSMAAGLERWFRQVRGPAAMPPLECRVTGGLAWEEILRLAGERQCDLIVMGAEGKTGVGRLLLGSAAEQVARHAKCPVLITKPSAGGETTASRGDGRPLFSTILLPTDLADPASRAFSLATALAGPGSRLIVQHVVPEAAVAAPALKSELTARLHQLYPEEAGRVSIVYRLSAGDPAEEIHRAAEDSHCDLIVMGTRGKTGIGRLLLGSVAEAVFRAVRAPVMILRDAVTEPVDEPVAIP